MVSMVRFKFVIMLMKQFRVVDGASGAFIAPFATVSSVHFYMRNIQTDREQMTAKT